MPETQKTAFESYLKAFTRRRSIFVAVFLVAMAGFGSLTLLMKPSYQTTSRVAIADIKNMNMRTPDYLDVYLPGATTMALAGDTYVALIQGLPMADKISDRLAEEGIFFDAERIAAGIKAEFFEPDMIEITTRAPDSLRAIALANASAEVFVDENRETIRRQLSRAVDFIESEMVDAQHEWENAQQRMVDFRSREHIAYVDSWMGHKMDEQAELAKNLDIMDSKIAAEKARQKEIAALLSVGTGTRLNPMEDAAMAILADRLGEVDADLAVARAEFSEGHSEVRRLESKREQLRIEMDRRVKELSSTERPVMDGEYYRGLRQKISESEVSLIGMEAERKGLQLVYQANNEEMAQLPSKFMQYQQISLQAQVAEDKLGRLMERLQSARIQVGGAQGNAAVIDLAVDATPSTTRMKLLMYAAVLSLMLAVGSVFVMEYLDDSLKTTDEMSRDLRITPLGVIPRVKQVEKRLLVPGDTGSPLFESYRIVRSGVRFASVNNPIRQLLVTSSLPGEGKSSTAVNLAVVMAAGGQRVLLVDADLRNPTIHKLMGIEPQVGLTSVLLGEAALGDCIVATPYDKLTVLPCGPVPPNPVELFESQGLRELIAELRNYADLVIFDSAPLLPVTDTSLLSATLDASVLVLASGTVTRDDAASSRRILENAGARLIGGVLNKVTHVGLEGYGYYGRANNDGRGDGRRGGTPGGGSRLSKSVSELAGRVTGRS